MAAEFQCAKTQTLAERLMALSAGDACPCCGSPLKPETAKLGGGGLTCSACGCGLDTEEWLFRVESRTRVCLAA